MLALAGGRAFGRSRGRLAGPGHARQNSAGQNTPRFGAPRWRTESPRSKEGRLSASRVPLHSAFIVDRKIGLGGILGRLGGEPCIRHAPCLTPALAIQ
eukprot:8854909-Lingulodinium_polyedra.AAC.1